MIDKAQWWAMHRFDIPVDGDWRGFAGVAHGGYQQQDTIIRRNPGLGLYSVIYTMLFCIVSVETDRPFDFPNYGDLFDGYKGNLPRTGEHITRRGARPRALARAYSRTGGMASKISLIWGTVSSESAPGWMPREKASA
jgi:hypothetical protein